MTAPKDHTSELYRIFTDLRIDIEHEKPAQAYNFAATKINRLIHDEVVKARIEELEKLTKADIYQISGQDILPNMSVWVVKRDYVAKRIAQLQPKEESFF